MRAEPSTCCARQAVVAAALGGGTAGGGEGGAGAGAAVATRAPSPIVPGRVQANCACFQHLHGAVVIVTLRTYMLCNIPLPSYQRGLQCVFKSALMGTTSTRRGARPGLEKNMLATSAQA